MSFLSKFLTILHVTEAAAAISAPFIAIADPTVGALVNQANQSAIAAEAAITTPGSGAQKTAMVMAQTGATIALINSIRGTQGKPPLPASVTNQVQAQVNVTIAGLNAIAAASPTLAPVAPAVAPAA